MPSQKARIYIPQIFMISFETIVVRMTSGLQTVKQDIFDKHMLDNYRIVIVFVAKVSFFVVVVVVKQMHLIFIY